MAYLQERLVEGACFGYFAELGYPTMHASRLAPDGEAPERPDYRTTVLRGRLESVLRRINPDAPQEALDQTVTALLRTDKPGLVDENARLHEQLVDGVTVETRGADGRIRHVRVRVVDFDEPADNDWLVVNQLTVDEERHRRRPDVVVYLNGLPVAVLELKSPEDEDATVHGAYRQLQVYKDEIPTLFRFNELLVASDGVSAAMGSLTAPWEHFAAWKTIDGEDEAAASMPQLEVLVRGVFEQRRLLDLLRHFVLFSDEATGLVKKIPKYHQYWAVNAAVDSTVLAAGEEGDGRAGVVWHTQGSGKSVEMVWYANKIMRHAAMANPTLVVLTDRNDLDDQLYAEHFTPARILPETPVQAETRDHLKALLRRPSGGIVFTTIQKFGVERQGQTFPELSDRSNIVVLADEAHRSQYDFIDGFAANIRRALPNAAFIGFTGTPIELDDRSTPQVFGDYIHVYDITRAVDDGATVPLYYESRLARVQLPGDVDLDERFEELTESQEAEGKQKVATRWSRLEAVVGADQRLELVARDIVEHWEARRAALSGKAMIVCMSRRICVDLYDRIVALRPDWHAEDDEQGRVKVVMTGSASDPEHWQPHIRSKQRLRGLKARAKDPQDELELVIVRDMWLTGFDSPPMHTMYVDKPMSGHSLMQAIARVNRRWRDKPAGLIVDYLGIADNLRSALANYSERDQDKVGIDINKAVHALKERHEVVVGILAGHDWSGAHNPDPKARLDAVAAMCDFLAGDPDRKQRFLDQTLALVKAYALAVPHPVTERLRDDVAFFQAVRNQLLKLQATGEGERPSGEELDTAISQVLSEAIVASEVIDVYDAAGIAKPDLSILSDEFLDTLQRAERKNLQMEVLKKLLNDEIRTIRRTNVVQYRKFSEMLQRTIQSYQNRALTTAEVLAELVELAKEIQSAHHRGEELGLGEDEFAFYEAVCQNDSAVMELGDDVLKEIATELVRILKDKVTIDWSKKESVRAQIRASVKRLLRRYNYPPDKQEAAVDLVLEQTELFSDKWSQAA